jgi:aminoglycoside/choline kinase family phosphotransferase
MASAYDPSVSLSDVKRLQSNERVRYAMQRYVHEGARAGASSEKAFQKAQQLLLSYATMVYSEE